MATFRPPFVSNDMRSLKRSIVAGIVKKIPTNYSSELESFIRKCLRVDAKERPSAEELLKDCHFEKMQEEEGSMRGSFKLIEKIQAPRKRDFRIIKDRLPRNKFSVDKIIDNSSCFSEKERNKENLVTINMD